MPSTESRGGYYHETFVCLLREEGGGGLARDEKDLGTIRSNTV